MEGLGLFYGGFFLFLGQSELNFREDVYIWGIYQVLFSSSVLETTTSILVGKNKMKICDEGTVV